MSSTIVTKPFAYDTNILIYSVDPSDTAKREISDRIVLRSTYAGFSIPLQCVTEFYRAVRKKRLLDPLTAERFVQSTMRAHALVAPNEDDILLAMQWSRMDGLQFFDALILATAMRMDCKTFFSEDFQHGRTYGRITVQDPFKMTAAEIESLLA
jgi:predicted nucleic acid-binding protein